MMLGTRCFWPVDHRGQRRGAGAVDRRARVQRGGRAGGCCTSGSAIWQRRCGSATASPARSSMSTTAAPMRRSPSRAGLRADALDVQVVSLSRNFGKEAALMAGLDHARRGAVLFMDGDGQHPPDLVEKLVGHWIDDGYDVVYTAKAHRDNESLLRRLAVHGFYALINWGARQKIPEDAGDFRLLSPRAAAALRQLPERNRFFKGLASWIGFRQIRVDYEPAAARARRHHLQPRPAGRAFDRRPDVVLGGAAALCEPARRVARDRGLPVRPFDPLGNLDHRKIGSRLSLAGGRPDDHRRRAAHHDRHCRRIYRQDSFRAEGAPDLFRRRAQREARRGGSRRRAPANGPRPNERRRAAAPDLAVRRRLRYQPRRQPRHSRPDRARPSQCHLGDGGRPGDRPRRSQRACRPPPPTVRAARSACTSR